MSDLLNSLLSPISSQGAFIFKGNITISSDFPAITEVQNGWTYYIAANVTDNDITKTNTGQSFLSADVISWDGINWIDVTGLEVFTQNGTDAKTINPALNIDLQNNILKNTDKIGFNLAHSGILAEGELGWNDTDKTLEIGMSGGNVNLQLGQEQLLRAKANGSAIGNGKAVYISGASGSNIEASLVSASNYTNANKTIAVATEDITQNQFGYFTTFGLVRGLNTNSFNEGDILWLSENGLLVNTMPSVPNCIVRVGYCLRKSLTEGIIFINIQIFNLDTITQATKDPTGFVEPENVIVSYDNLTRKITLSGTNLTAFWRGIPVSTITAGLIDLALPANITQNYYLTWDDTNGYQWSTIFDVSKIFIAIAVSNDSDVVFCLRECHGLMPWQAHRNNHIGIGTLRTSGGDVSGIVLNSTTTANRRPVFSSINLLDEDFTSLLASVSSGSYTRFRLNGASSTPTYTFSGSDIVNLSGSQPYYNQFTGGAWQETLLPNNFYMSVWALAIPTTSDSFSNVYRLLFIQGQTANINLGVIQAETSLNVNLGSLSSPENVFVQRFIIQYTAGNWSVVQSDRLTGSRVSQSSLSGSTGLTAISVDINNLQGNGNPTSPVALYNFTNTFGIETKVLNSFADTLGNAVIYDYYVSDGSNSRAGTIMANWNATTNVLEYIESTTTDIGSTSSISFNMDISTDLVRLNVVSTGAGFTFKSYRRIL